MYNTHHAQYLRAHGDRDGPDRFPLGDEILVVATETQDTQRHAKTRKTARWRDVKDTTAVAQRQRSGSAAAAQRQRRGSAAAAQRQRSVRVASCLSVL
jgi:hypothetical protein